MQIFIDTYLRPFHAQVRSGHVEIRPDWDLSAPELRENWEGDKKLHYPYKERK